MSETVSSCFAALSVIKKIRNMAPKALKKQLVEALVLSKVDYNDIVVYPLPQYLEAKLQRVQKSAASFVNNHYANMAVTAKSFPRENVNFPTPRGIANNLF